MHAALPGKVEFAKNFVILTKELNPRTENSTLSSRAEHSEKSRDSNALVDPSSFEKGVHVRAARVSICLERS